jgi:hypothetical protein
MIRLVRQLIAVLVAVAWVAGTLAPAALADASLAPSPVAVAQNAAPCHGGDLADTHGSDTGKPCPLLALCAKCFQAAPSAAVVAVTAPITVAAARLDFADETADGHSPSPPLKIPRA